MVVFPVASFSSCCCLLALGEKRSGASYTTEDLRLLRVVVNQSAVALENARAFSALEEANRRLADSLRRVEILEAIRASLAKFVPAARVRQLIEESPEAPVARQARDRRDGALRRHHRLYAAHLAQRRRSRRARSSSATSAPSSTRSSSTAATSTRRRATGSW